MNSRQDIITMLQDTKAAIERSEKEAAGRPNDLATELTAQSLRKRLRILKSRLAAVAGPAVDQED